MLSEYFNNNIKPSVDKLEKLQGVRHIPITVYEEIKNVFHAIYLGDEVIQWIDNTPYLITIVNKGNENE